MALRQTRLYYNTGFNAGNTPGNISILNSANYIDLEAHWDYQDFFLQSIRLKATYDQVKNADYLKYGEAYYWVAGIQMLNTNTAQIFLQLDALASMGGAKTLTYTSGMLTRAHPLSDTVFSNLLPEPVGKQRPLDTNVKMLGSSSTDFSLIIMSTLGLYNSISVDTTTGQVSPIGDVNATSYKVLGVDAGEVIVPQSPRPATGTKVGTVYSPNDYYLVESADDMKKISYQIAYLRSLGLEQAVVGCYVIPKVYATKGTAIIMDSVGAGFGKIKEIKTGLLAPTANGQNWKKHNRRWNKTETINNIYVVQSLLTGDTKTFKASDICRNNELAPVFSIGYDSNVGGKPYCWPMYFEGNSMQSLFNANGVTGADWLTMPIVIGGASGSLWTKNDYVRNTAQIGTETVQMGYNAVKSVLSNIVPGSSINSQQVLEGIASGNASFAAQGVNINANPTGIIDTAANTAFNSAKLMYRAEKLDTDFTKATEFAVPAVQGGNIQGLQTSIANNFLCYHSMLNSADYDKIDTFFDKYGYAQDCAFDKAYLTDHWNLGYVYIQTSDIHIGRTGKANDVGIAVKNLAESQLDGGIRIWDRLPS